MNWPYNHSRGSLFIDNFFFGITVQNYVQFESKFEAHENIPIPSYPLKIAGCQNEFQHVAPETAEGSGAEALLGIHLFVAQPSSSIWSHRSLMEQAFREVPRLIWTFRRFAL